jgi:1-acyl-sn-glycerol-3-phosphate acyltransferase
MIQQKGIGMPQTVYETRMIRPALRWVALIVYRCFGWRTEGKKPASPKYVVIAAPHTSNWDFFFTVCLAFIYRLNPQMMMKAEWFFWPLGPLFRWLGAIPVDRSKSRNVVAQSIAAFQRSDQMMLVVPPAGTRRRVLYWKTGFYHIANGAGVPIALGFLDYQRKVGGFGPIFNPTGDIDGDMVAIRRFYADITGKNPLQESTVVTISDAGTRR